MTRQLRRLLPRRARLLDRGVLAGFGLAPLSSELSDAVLVCATDLTTASDVETLATAWREELRD